MHLDGDLPVVSGAIAKSIARGPKACDRYRTDLVSLPGSSGNSSSCQPDAPWVQNMRHQAEIDDQDRAISAKTQKRTRVTVDMHSAFESSERNRELEAHRFDPEKRLSAWMAPNRHTTLVDGRLVQVKTGVFL